MAPDGQILAPNVHEAESIPEAARAEIDRLLSSGDLFRYTAPANAPVALLEQEFADLLGARYALAVSSCSAALFPGAEGAGPAERRESADPGLHLRSGAVLGRACRM